MTWKYNFQHYLFIFSVSKIILHHNVELSIFEHSRYKPKILYWSLCFRYTSNAHKVSYLPNSNHHGSFYTKNSIKQNKQNYKVNKYHLMKYFIILLFTVKLGNILIRYRLYFCYEQCNHHWFSLCPQLFESISVL